MLAKKKGTCYNFMVELYLGGEILPNIKSAIKRVEVNETKNLRNRMIKSSIHTTVRKLEKAAEQGDNALTEALFRQTVSAYDKAASKGIIHKNAVNRKKAKMAKIAAKTAQ